MKSSSHLTFPLLIAGTILLCGSALADTPITNGGARVYLDLSMGGGDEIVVSGLLTGATVSSNGNSVSASIGALTRNFRLNADGQAQNSASYLEVHTDTGGLTFTFNAQAADLDTVFAPQGLTNTTVTGQASTMPISVMLNGTTYSASLTGTYTAVQNKSGTATYGTFVNTNKGKPVIHIKTVHAKPNPTQANVAVIFSGELSISGLTGTKHGHISFGDGSALVRAPGKSFVAMMASGISHSYTTDGVYVAHIVLQGDNATQVSRLFVIVGPDRNVNLRNGLITTLQRNGGGNITLTYDISNVPGAATCSTTFRDESGKPPPLPPTTGLPPDPAAPEVGLTVSRTFLTTGVYVSSCKVLDAGNNVIGHGHTTIVIDNSNFAVGTNVRTASAQPRDTGNQVITFTSMSGKFIFNSSTPDKVLFSGTLQLPAGYILKNPSGNDVNMSMGNVQDVLHLDAKNRLTLPTQNGLIQKFRLTAHIKGGVAIGGETAKVSITMKASDLDLSGFDTEGITGTLRSDEQGMTSVDRSIQMNMLVGGQGYELQAPVEFKLNSSSDFGTIGGRH